MMNSVYLILKYANNTVWIKYNMVISFQFSSKTVNKERRGDIVKSVYVGSH